MPSARLIITKPGDVYEQDADRVATEVMRAMPWSAKPMRQSALVQSPIGRGGEGNPLPESVRAFMEPRFGADFGHVRVHTGGEAAELCRRFQAQALTIGSHIYFGTGMSPANDMLTAHELAHVVQQAGRSPMIARQLELRHSNSVASAFHRRQELIDRLNTVSPAIQYDQAPTGNPNIVNLRCAVINEHALTYFDRQMQGFIDRLPPEVVPMRLVGGRGRTHSFPVFFDSFVTAYVDLDDLMACDIWSFQSRLLHLLTERFHVRDYARRIGSPGLIDAFDAAHRAGRDAEAAQLQFLLNDPSIRFRRQTVRPGPVWINSFLSRTHRYVVYEVSHGILTRESTGGRMWVERGESPNIRVSMEDFIRERAR